MMNWAKSQKVGLSMLSFLGDPNSEFTRALVSYVEERVLGLLLLYVRW
jgi:peroxiredoxin